MKAVCYACGREKSEPLVVCDHCEVKPLSVKDKTSSICLSDLCLDDASLQKGSRFLREKRKLPKFGERLIKKATEIVESLESEESQYTLMDVDDSFLFTYSFE